MKPHQKQTSEFITLPELLSMDGFQFVKNAYAKILLREPDPGGLVNYLEKLESGQSKIDILRELSQSEEGRSRRVEISGLEDIPPSRSATKSLFSAISRIIRSDTAKTAMSPFGKDRGRRYDPTSDRPPESKISATSDAFNPEIEDETIFAKNSMRATLALQSLRPLSQRKSR